ncbi:MAG: hypothetical protein IJM64_07085 [Ottowia sp.]|nr:hypothetical protein [Ottowia sp.]
MSTPQTLALDLSKINLSLHMRLLQLAQKNAQLWLDLGQRLLENNAASSEKAQDTLQGVSEWAQMAQLPGDTYWGQVQEALNNVQTAMQESISAQSKIGADAQNVLRDWQQQVLQSMGCLTSPAVDAQQPSWQAAWAPLQGMFAAMQGGMQNAWQGLQGQGAGDASNWMEQWQQMMANAMPNIPGMPQFGGQK